MPFLHPASGAGGLATQTTDAKGAWYCYRAQSGTYYAVNKLTGDAEFSHATAFDAVFDDILAEMPGDATTANSALCGGDIELGGHVFNCDNPLNIQNKRSVTLRGQGKLQQTIIAQNAQFSSGEYVLQAGAANDAAILQGIMVRDLQIRGKRGDGTATIGGGIKAYVAWSRFQDIVIQETNDTGFYWAGASSSQKGYSTVIKDVNIVNFGRVGVFTASGLEIGANVSDGDVIGLYAYSGAQRAFADAHGLHGVHVSGLSGTIRFKDCHVYFVRGHGYYAESGADLYFTDCIAETCGNNGLRAAIDGFAIDGGAYYSNGIYTSAGADATSSGTGVTTADFSNILLSGVDRFSIRGLRFEKRRATTVDAARNLQLSACTEGVVADCTFVDAPTAGDHILVSGASSVIDIHDNIFGEGRDYGNSPNIDGGTPTWAIQLTGAASHVKVHDNIINADSGIREVATFTGNYNEIYHNRLLGSGAVTLLGAESRKWGNRDSTNALLPDRIYGGKGADAASANDTTLGHGKYFDITGTTQINGIATAGWDTGVVITLQFDSNPTVKHNTAASAGFASLLLAGAGDFSASAGDTLSLLYDGSTWREVARAVI